jgi:hypothetical protein
MKEQAEEIAIQFILPYVKRGDSIEQITEGHMGHWGTDYQVQVGGSARINEKLREFNRYQVIVLEIQKQTCLEIFDIYKLVDNIKNGQQLSLWGQTEA